MIITTVKKTTPKLKIKSVAINHHHAFIRLTVEHARALPWGRERSLRATFVGREPEARSCPGSVSPLPRRDGSGTLWLPTFLLSCEAQSYA